MIEAEKKYMVWERDGDDHGYMDLNKLSTDSMIEAFAYFNRRGCANGIKIWDEEDQDYQELSMDDVRKIFFEELKSMVINGKHLEIQQLMGESFQAPPIEFMQFMREHFQQPKPRFSFDGDPYRAGITISGDTTNLVTGTIPTVEL